MNIFHQARVGTALAVVVVVIDNFVKSTRMCSNTTMADLAARSGIGIATLARIKKGICSADNLVKVLAALGKLDTLITTLRPIEVFSLPELRAMNKKSLNNERIEPPWKSCSYLKESGYK